MSSAPSGARRCGVVVPATELGVSGRLAGPVCTPKHFWSPRSSRSAGAGGGRCRFTICLSYGRRSGGSTLHRVRHSGYEKIKRVLVFQKPKESSREGAREGPLPLASTYLQRCFHDEVLLHEAHEGGRVFPGRHPPQRDPHEARRAAVDEVVLVPADVAAFRFGDRGMYQREQKR